MKEKSEIRKLGTVAARPARDAMSAQQLTVINEADLDQVSGGGGAPGGVLGDRRLK